MILQVTGQFPLLNWFCSKFSVHMKWDVVTHCLPSSLRFITKIDPSVRINMILFPISPCSWQQCLSVPWGPHIWETIIFLLAFPALLQTVVESLPNVHERKHRNALLSQPFTNNSTVYELFKSNLARVLRTSNHILVLAAMTIFGHIFLLLMALHWLFSIISYIKFMLSHPRFYGKPIVLSSGFPVPTNRKEESFSFAVSSSCFQPFPAPPPRLLSIHRASGVLPSNPQSKSSG